MNEQEYILKAGRWNACVADFGASLRRFWSGDRDYLWGYQGGSHRKLGGQGDVLIPFPGRLRDGRYRFEGRGHQLPRNDKEGPNAIHGFVRAKRWETLGVSDASVRFRTLIRDVEGYPFSIEAEVGYRLSPSGELTCDFSLRNAGDRAAPVGAGFHPYFTPSLRNLDDWELEIPARDVIEFDSAILPTGRTVAVADCSALDFRRPRKIGATRINNAFRGMNRATSGPDAGRALVRLRDPSDGSSGLVVWMDEAFDFLVVYTGDAIAAPGTRRGLAIEPQTCGPDAFNQGPGFGARVLAPGQVFNGSWGVRVEGV